MDDKIGANLDSTDLAARARLFNLQYGSSQGRSSHGLFGSLNGGPELRLFSTDEIDLREQLELEAAIAASQKQMEEEEQLKQAIQKAHQ